MTRARSAVEDLAPMAIVAFLHLAMAGIFLVNRAPGTDAALTGFPRDMLELAGPRPSAPFRWFWRIGKPPS